MAKDFDELQYSLNDALQEYLDLDGRSVVVGLPLDRIHNPSGLPLAELGAMHEFGTGDLPERSFLRGSLRAGKDDIKDKMAIIAERASRGEDPEMLLDAFAQFGEGLVVDYMRNGAANFVPLSGPRPDGSSNPLNDTGELIQGVIGVVVDD